MFNSASQAAVAQDDVVHRRKGIVVRGKILSYDSSGVRLRSGDGKESFIPAAEIDRVDVKLTAEQQEAEKLLERGEHGPALEKLRAALAAETRPWLRSRLESNIVAAHVALGDTLAAIDAFLAASPGVGGPSSWNVVPVCWLSDAPPAAVRQQAASLLRSGDPLRQVIGASYLLGTEESAAARNALSKLTTRDERIGTLARTQLWRWDVDRAAPEDVEAWQRQAAKLPAESRAGAHFVIGLALQRLGKHEDAALEFLWPALVDQPDPRLASRAALLAAQSLEQAGQAAEAKQLYGEIIARFAKSTEAAAARTRIQALKE